MPVNAKPQAVWHAPSPGCCGHPSHPRQVHSYCPCCTDSVAEAWGRVLLAEDPLSPCGVEPGLKPRLVCGLCSATGCPCFLQGPPVLPGWKERVRPEHRVPWDGALGWVTWGVRLCAAFTLASEDNPTGVGALRCLSASSPSIMCFLDRPRSVSALENRPTMYDVASGFGTLAPPRKRL